MKGGCPGYARRCAVVQPPVFWSTPMLWKVKTVSGGLSYFPVGPKPNRITDFRKPEFSRKTMLARHSWIQTSKTKLEQITWYFYIQFQKFR